MANTTLPQGDARHTYVPNRTLGRSGYIEDKKGQLSGKITHLDALLLLMTMAPDSDDPNDFASVNSDIQSAVLSLASTLASEIHELHEELFISELNAKFPCNGHKPQPLQ